MPPRQRRATRANWREILEYFEPAYQLGMTATPLREDNRDTYRYFGNPIYQYSLRQGIDDGFLAPYRVHRVITTGTPPAGGRAKDELDRYGREIPDEEYQTKDFERGGRAAGPHRGHRAAPDGLPQEDRPLRQDHRLLRRPGARRRDARRLLNNLNADLVQQYPDYVCRVTADEGKSGAATSAAFKTWKPTTPVILTTSQLLTTGVDAPTCKNVVLARVVGSMTRVQADHRPRHARARRLRQALVQHPRLHRLGHPALRRSGIRRRPGVRSLKSRSTTTASQLLGRETIHTGHGEPYPED